MKIKSVLLLLVLAVIVGCKTPSSQLSLVHLGMSEPDVIKVLGQPASVVENRNGRMLYYMLREDWAGAILSPYSVKIVDGKVDNFGRDEGGVQRSAVVVTPPPVVH